MSSFAQKESVREQLSAAEETSRLREGTIVQNENEELCGQRRLLDITWNPQLQLHQIVLPQHWGTEEEELCNQQMNFKGEQEDLQPLQPKEELTEPEVQNIEMKQEETENHQIKDEPEEEEPPQIKEEQEELELPWVKEEQEHICISQDEGHLDVKQEIDTLMEIPSREKNGHSNADLNKQKSFNVTESQYGDENQHKEPTSTTDEETDPQNRDQMKKRGKSYVQSLGNSHMSESQCDDVGKKINNETSVEKHKQSPKQNRLSPVKSGKRRINTHNVSGHMRAESDEKPLVCKVCGKNVGYLSQLKTQMKTHTIEKPFCCQECDKCFEQISNLKSHIIHTGEKPFYCQKCDKSFDHMSHLKTHMRTHTGENHFCQGCDKGFRHLSSFRRHMASHAGKKPFYCHHCDKRFFQRCNLKSHMKLHTGEKQFCCQECDKSFSHMSHLKMHMRTHTGEKPFKCQECDRSFTQISSLKSHMRTHTREKPFYCQECDKSFSVVSNLKRHVRAHSGEKPFHCQECNKSFSQLCNLKTHMRTHTKEKAFIEKPF